MANGRYSLPLRQFSQNNFVRQSLWRIAIPGYENATVSVLSLLYSQEEISISQPGCVSTIGASGEMAQEYACCLCFAPSQSPWLNPIEPKWGYGKEAIIERHSLLSDEQLAQRICEYFECSV